MARLIHRELKLPPLPFDQPLPRLSRITPPAYLPKANRLVGSDALPTGVDVLRALKARPELYEPLLKQTTVVSGDRHPHRPRQKGSFALLYIAMVADGYVHSRQVHKIHRAQSQVWQLAGFERRLPDGTRTHWVPSRSVMYERFKELELFSDAFQAAAGMLIQRADQHCRGLISRDIHVDGTQSQSNARLVHACKPGECTQPDKPNRPKSQTATSQDVKEDRARLAQVEDLEEGDLVGDVARSRLDPATGQRQVKIGKSPCWWACVDPDAGCRTYSRGGKKIKSWIGYYNQKAISHFVGAPIAVVDASASVNEHLIYPQTLEAIIKNTGSRPRAVVGDLAFDNAMMRQLNGEQGIATVTPRRAKLRPHTSIADGMGVPRCTCCGGPASVTRVLPLKVDEETGKREEARIWLQCDERTLDACEKPKTRRMSDDWVGLNPLPPTEEAHQALLHSHLDYERSHHLWRNRYGVAGDNCAIRLKSRGLGAQRLRSQVSLLIEWLRISTREGWLGSPRTNRHQPHFVSAEGYLRALDAERADLELDLPYGTQAVRRGVGPMNPGDPRPAPSTGAPPGD